LVLVWQILIAVVVLVGLITIIMSVKNWHWAQMLLLLAIFFTSIGVFFLGMEVYRIHRNLRAGMPAKKQQIAELEEVNRALRQGTKDQEVITRAFAGDPFNGEIPYQGLKQMGDDEAAASRMPGLPVLESWLRVVMRDRGPVWDGVKAAGPVDPATGRIPVAIPGGPRGLEVDMIVYAFERGAPNGAQAEQGAQFLGEFRVHEVGENGVMLESVQKLDNRTGNRLLRSAQNPQVTWRLYGSMPLDRHELFAGMSEQELRQLLPAESVEEYLRHGKEPTPDDDPYERAAFNELGERVALDDPKKTEERYDRPLRDYAYLFAELMRQRTVLSTAIDGLREDISRLNAANESAKQLTAYRQEEIAVLEKDRDFMLRDRQTIEAHRDKVLAALERARQAVARLIPDNLNLAQQLIQRQTAQLQGAEAPGGAEFLSAPGGQ
jgi:hypothetical protein